MNQQITIYNVLTSKTDLNTLQIFINICMYVKKKTDIRSRLQSSIFKNFSLITNIALNNNIQTNKQNKKGVIETNNPTNNPNVPRIYTYPNKNTYNNFFHMPKQTSSQQQKPRCVWEKQQNRKYNIVVVCRLLTVVSAARCVLSMFT